MIKRFRDWRIKTKIIAAFLSVALVAAAIGYVGISVIDRLDRANEELRENNLVIEYINAGQQEFAVARLNPLDFALADSADRFRYLEGIEQTSAKISELMASVGEAIDDDAVAQRFQDLIPAMESYRAVRGEVIALFNAGEYEAATTLLQGDQIRIAQETDDLIVEAREETDPDRRAELYTQIEEAFFGPEGEYPIAPLYVRIAYVAVHEWVDGVEALFGGQQWYNWTIDAEAKATAQQ